MKLSKLLEGIEVLNEYEDIEIANIESDSRKVKENTLFICIKGENNDGHDYINQAIESGAIAILVNEEYEGEIDNNIVVIKVKENEKAMAQVACNYFDHPSKKFKLIGVTGTKGKTTTTYMIKNILETAGKKVGLIGTITNMIGDKKYSTNNTTPGAIQLQALFYKMAQEGVDVAVMEVSSHALAMERVYGCDFDIGVFTNLSQDHMDFHETFDNYIAAKQKLFDMCKQGFVNCDDIYSLRIEKGAKCPITRYGLDNGPQIFANNLIITNSYVDFTVIINNRPDKVRVGIPGRFTVYNALAAISATLALNIDYEAVKEGLMTVKVPGRSEIVPNMHGKTIMIDYAHSPDSLENILKAVKSYTKGKVICVFGCGGDRDTTKRPIMGEISGKIADFTIITSDNPRTENPKEIVKQIEEGIKKTKGRYTVIVDRTNAIKSALEMCGKYDIVVLAGKGHETYQVLKDGKIHYDEREVIAKILKKMPIPEDNM
ncbi:MAG: UDP-N-acetylmuramoyl-L-alanyl-D-glutamate--2,6-diaminopimelate ligase [Clostridiales bacterium]|nr:UDP-N-acetylmuramoyl-L-alanyl-D-glutamate--2,6-diaminopimelate ligase [Clostridiales bacterium]